MLQKREMQKKYWAVVKNKPPYKNGKLIHFLKKNEKQNKSYVVKNGTEGSKKAELSYKVLDESQNYYLLEADLITGRHHQVRAQLSAIGCPIKGDLKYGFDRSNKNASIHLHARQLSFLHPVKKTRINIVAPLPDDVLWNLFEK